jgi:drug/metabolite transporter (DMT)-like permease
VSKKSKAEAALLGTTLIWGSTFVAQKIGLQEISPLLLVTCRFTTAAVVFLLLFGRKIFPLHLAAVLKGSLLGFFLFLGFVVQTIGLNHTSASKSAFITSMMVVFVPLLQFVVERRSPTLGNTMGVVVVSAGLWLLTSPSGSSFTVGDALTLVGAVLFAVYIVYLDVVSHEMSTLQLTFLQTACVAVCSGISLLLLEHAWWVASQRLVMSLIYLTLLATVATTYIQTRFQKDTTPTRAAIIFTVEPVIASVLAYLILGEHLGALGVVGGGLIILGVLLSELSDAIPLLSRTFSLSEEDTEVSP